MALGFSSTSTHRLVVLTQVHGQLLSHFRSCVTSLVSQISPVSLVAMLQCTVSPKGPRAEPRESRKQMRQVEKLDRTWGTGQDGPTSTPQQQANSPRPIDPPEPPRVVCRNTRPRGQCQAPWGNTPLPLEVRPSGGLEQGAMRGLVELAVRAHRTARENSPPQRCAPREHPVQHLSGGSIGDKYTLKAEAGAKSSHAACQVLAHGTGRNANALLMALAQECSNCTESESRNRMPQLYSGTRNKLRVESCGLTVGLEVLVLYHAMRCWAVSCHQRGIPAGATCA
jgi:hypothetical protein